MFGLFKKDKRPLEQKQDFSLELEKSPRTKSLISYAQKSTDAAEVDLRKMLGSVREIKHSQNLEDQVFSAISVISFEILISAMERNSIRMFLPSEKIPVEAPVCVAFQILTAYKLAEIVEEEGYSISKEKLITSPSMLFLLHEKEEMISTIQKGIDIFKNLLISDQKNVRDWLESFNFLVIFYVMHLSGEVNKKPINEILKMFGGLLEGFLKAIER